MKEEEDPEQQFPQQQLPLLSEDVLDIDIQEALNEIHQFLQRQRQARQTCINLLIKSQCQFGSIDAAKAFENILEKLHLVKKPKLLLSDAMQLEVSGGNPKIMKEELTSDSTSVPSLIAAPDPVTQDCGCLHLTIKDL